MKLYYSPGACSLSPHIILEESGIEHEMERVDLKNKLTETGANYIGINSKGSVPALELDNGEVLTEGPAILQYLADLVPHTNLAPANGTMPRYRLQEVLNFITSDIHKTFVPLFDPTVATDTKNRARQVLHAKFGLMDRMLERSGGPYIFGRDFMVADAYLFTVGRWAERFDVEVSNFESLGTFMDAMKNRFAVKTALRQEGLET